MRVRVPKPLHGWRAFAGEVGVIVLGVLIALGAQQAAEALNGEAKLPRFAKTCIERSGTINRVRPAGS